MKTTTQTEQTNALINDLQNTLESFSHLCGVLGAYGSGIYAESSQIIGNQIGSFALILEVQAQTALKQIEEFYNLPTN